MNFEYFKKFIEEQDQLFRSLDTTLSEKEHVLYRTIKIGEEYGELCDAILSSGGNQRKNKLTKYKEGDLEGEFADVIITTFLLAEAMKINLYDAIIKKTEKIKNKHNTQLEQK